MIKQLISFPKCSNIVKMNETISCQIARASLQTADSCVFLFVRHVVKWLRVSASGTHRACMMLALSKPCGFSTRFTSMSAPFSLTRIPTQCLVGNWLCRRTSWCSWESMHRPRSLPDLTGSLSLCFVSIIVLLYFTDEHLLSRVSFGGFTFLVARW